MTAEFHFPPGFPMTLHYATMITVLMWLSVLVVGLFRIRRPGNRILTECLGGFQFLGGWALLSLFLLISAAIFVHPVVLFHVNGGFDCLVYANLGISFVVIYYLCFIISYPLYEILQNPHVVEIIFTSGRYRAVVVTRQLRLEEQVRERGRRAAREQAD